VATASSMALITTSGSMPFSLASASMVCCRGFDISKFHFQIRARNYIHRNAMLPAILGLDQHRLMVNTAEPPLEILLAVDRTTHHQLRTAAREPTVVVGVTKRSIESRRRDFQGVCVGDYVFDIKHRAQIAADLGTVLDAYTVLCRS